MIRLMIVEDNADMLNRLELILSGESELGVVGAFRSAEAALEKLEEIDPDLALLDIGLPGMGGIELIGILRQKSPRTEIMVHSVHSDHSTLFAAIRAGANGYLEKGASPRELIESLLELAGGGSPMSPRIARSVMATFRDSSQNSEAYLTQAEHKVLTEIDQGKSYKEVAAELSVSRNTVHSHIKKIYSKLQSTSRSEALDKARKKGLI